METNDMGWFGYVIGVWLFVLTLPLTIIAGGAYLVDKILR